MTKIKVTSRGRKLNDAAIDDLTNLLKEHHCEPLERSRLIEYLHIIQDNKSCITLDYMAALAHLMKLSYTEVYEVATFYHHFDVVHDGEIAPAEVTIRVCDSVSCQLAGSDALTHVLNSRYHPAQNKIRIQHVPCVGRCHQAPVAVVKQNPIGHADLEKISQALEDKQFNETIAELSDEQKRYEYAQYRRLLNGDIDDDAIIDILQHAGLRGLGGAGFPAGKKWQIVKSFAGPRIMAVNIDEGEPGTFKDRHYIERAPKQFIEGMLIAAKVVGTEQVYVYIRDEYPACRQRLIDCIDEVKTLFSDLPMIEVRRGAGAYICGEESAMIESIEGKKGMPRLRPPFVAEVGVFGRPTLEHNFETLFWVPTLMEKGAEWFASHGRNERKGLRSFSVSGRVKKPGVHLAPAGITVTELIEEYCGGMLDGHEFYGYFPGGASGGILPKTMADIPLDFDTLNQYGCFIGSAAVIILSDKDKAKDVALNAMKFFKHESCGKCTPCRVGTSKAVQLMESDKWDIDLMKELTSVMMDASICGLGQAAPNPLLSVIKYFPEELKT